LVELVVEEQLFVLIGELVRVRGLRETRVRRRFLLALDAGLDAVLDVFGERRSVLDGQASRLHVLRDHAHGRATERGATGLPEDLGEDLIFGGLRGRGTAGGSFESR